MGLQGFRRLGPLILGVIAVMIVVAAAGLVLRPTDPPPRLVVPADAPVAPDDPATRSGVIGDEDRVPLQAFVLPGAPDQAAVRRQLAATQTLSCDASASLVYRNDVIVFAAHELLWHDGSYRTLLETCTFDVARLVDGKRVVEHVPILWETLDNGPLVEDGSDTDYEKWYASNVADWVVVRLARPVADLQPYALPDAAQIAALARPGQRVVTASKATDGWKGNPHDVIAQSCSTIPLTDHVAKDYPAILHFDCDSNGGASGIAILADLGKGQLVDLAIEIAYSGGHCAVADVDTCFMIGRRLDADLVERIKGTTGTPAPEDVPLVAAQAARIGVRRDRTAAAIKAALQRPYPPSHDAVGEQVAKIYKEIAAKLKAGDEASTPVLFRAAADLLGDADERPEWAVLLQAEAVSLLRQHKVDEAREKFVEAEYRGPAVLRPYYRLRIALTEHDPEKRRAGLVAAYAFGGDKLFELVHASAALAETKALLAARARGATTIQ